MTKKISKIRQTRKALEELYTVAIMCGKGDLVKLRKSDIKYALSKIQKIWESKEA